MPRYRITETVSRGMGGPEEVVREVDLADGETVPEGAKRLPDEKPAKEPKSSK